MPPFKAVMLACTLVSSCFSISSSFCHLHMQRSTNAMRINCFFNFVPRQINPYSGKVADFLKKIKIEGFLNTKIDGILVEKLIVFDLHDIGLVVEGKVLVARGCHDGFNMFNWFIIPKDFDACKEKMAKESYDGCFSWFFGGSRHHYLMYYCMIIFVFCLMACHYVKHRSLTAASICGMLGMFQNDDAACRLIARLKKERDEAWSLLERQESINKL
ncbi:hypothetical protein CUMW_206530 [Citrus unshiu]|nr:hypothetical protein CUMW_206530 [Citrus unshiu]